ncbi:MAG: hypothetical protein KDD76_03415, partial [Rickettsiales bacterium]|nr:hypothetical protein [Rickettsiales bacterium]
MITKNDILTSLNKILSSDVQSGPESQNITLVSHHGAPFNLLDLYLLSRLVDKYDVTLLPETTTSTDGHAITFALSRAEMFQQIPLSAKELKTILNSEGTEITRTIQEENLQEFQYGFESFAQDMYQSWQQKTASRFQNIFNIPEHAQEASLPIPLHDNHFDFTDFFTKCFTGVGKEAYKDLVREQSKSEVTSFPVFNDNFGSFRHSFSYGLTTAVLYEKYMAAGRSHEDALKYAADVAESIGMLYEFNQSPDGYKTLSSSLSIPEFLWKGWFRDTSDILQEVIADNPDIFRAFTPIKENDTYADIQNNKAGILIATKLIDHYHQEGKMIDLPRGANNTLIVGESAFYRNLAENINLVANYPEIVPKDYRLVTNFTGAFNTPDIQNKLLGDGLEVLEQIAKERHNFTLSARIQALGSAVKKLSTSANPTLTEREAFSLIQSNHLLAEFGNFSLSEAEQRHIISNLSNDNIFISPPYRGEHLDYYPLDFKSIDIHTVRVTLHDHIKDSSETYVLNPLNIEENDAFIFSYNRPP